MTDNANGTVFIFNATIQDVTLNLNGRGLTEIGATTADSHYVPNLDAAARNQSTDPGTEAEFGQKNHLLVTFGSNSHMYEITIDPAVAPIGNDLQLYLFYSDPVLIMGGNVIKDGIKQLY